MELNRSFSLNAATLKWIALISMVIDHIGYFFSMPIFFRWVGRLAAPIFLYLVVEGFCHTHNLRRYLLRMYAVAVGMGIINLLLALYGGGLRADGLTPDNSICSMFFLLLLFLTGIREIREKRELRGLLLICAPFLVSVLAMSLLPNKVSFCLLTTVLPSPFYAEGGMQYLGLGILLYLFHGRKKVQFIAFACYSIFFNVLFLIGSVNSPAVFFFQYYQWMEIFALIPLWYYNGERGHSPRWFFYAFYPGHIYLLYFISTLFL